MVKTMGAYKYITETLQKQYKERGTELKRKIVQWRREPVINAVDRPSNLARARILGYKAKQGYVVVRTRIEKGRRTRVRPMGGRKQKNYYVFVQPGISHQAMAEQRVNRRYKNLEVINSYWVGEDGNYKFYEVILADPSKGTVISSSVRRKARSFRGLTSAGNAGTPNKKKGINKRLRRKKAEKKPYHYEKYQKKPEKQENQRPDRRKSRAAKRKAEKAAKKAPPAKEEKE